MIPNEDVLIDTSIWIEILNGNIQPEPEQYLRFYTCLPVIQEILQGLRSGKQSDLFQERFLKLPCLEPSLQLTHYKKAAGLYKLGRSKGYTIRSSADCLIAAIAIYSGKKIWHKDRDFEHIKKFSTLQTFKKL